MKKSLLVVASVILLMFGCDNRNEVSDVITPSDVLLSKEDPNKVAQQIIYKSLLLQESFNKGQIKTKKNVDILSLREKAKTVDINNKSEAIAFYSLLVNNPEEYYEGINSIRLECKKLVSIRKDLRSLDRAALRANLANTLRSQVTEANAIFANRQGNVRVNDAWGPTTIMGPDNSTWTYGGTPAAGSYQYNESLQDAVGNGSGGGGKDIPDAAFQQFGICSASLGIGLNACQETLGVELCFIELAVITGGGALPGALAGCAAVLQYYICKNEQIANFDNCLIGAGFYKK